MFLQCWNHTANPNIGGVTLHESGHAFDFSIASISPNMAVSPSTSYAFSDVVGNVSGSTQTAASDFYYLIVEEESPTTVRLSGV